METYQPLTISLFIAGVLRNPLNQRIHWAARHRTTDRWKVATRLEWLTSGRPTWDGPCVFTFTAYTARRWDENEGVMAAIKPCRDEIVRCVCQTDDSPASGHVFHYQQKVSPQYRGVGIEIVTR